MIDEYNWWQIQHLLGNTKRSRQILNEAVPLRGVLNCFCNQPLTAGNSKGKKNYYWYYKCNSHYTINLSANKLHTQFNEMLDCFSLKPIQLNYLHNKAEQEMEDQLRNRKQMLVQVEKKWKEAIAQVDTLEEKFINNHVGLETYQKWYNTYKSQEAALRNQKEQLQDNNNAKWQLFHTTLPKLGDIKYLYESATLVQKQEFVRRVFNSKLYYLAGVYRTPYLLNLFFHNTLILKEKGLLIIEQPGKKIAKNWECAPGGN